MSVRINITKLLMPVLIIISSFVVLLDTIVKNKLTESWIAAIIANTSNYCYFMFPNEIALLMIRYKSGTFVGWASIALGAIVAWVYLVLHKRIGMWRAFVIYIFVSVLAAIIVVITS
jgi:hypothetical protein